MTQPTHKPIVWFAEFCRDYAGLCPAYGYRAIRERPESFPPPKRRSGGRKIFVLAKDVEKWLAGFADAGEQPAKRGRPTKASQIAKQKRGTSK